MGEKPQKLQRGGGRGVLREFSSGGVVYKNNLWLLSKSKPSELYPIDVWRLQKGWIDDIEDGKLPGPISSGKIKATEEDLQKAAIREVAEEGGVEAKIIKKIGTEKYIIDSKVRKAKTLKFVTFYLMEYVKDLEDGFGEETSEIAWLEFDEALKRLSYSGEKDILKKAKSLLI